jgi:hypothetical protein
MKATLFLKSSLAALALGLAAPSLSGEIAMAQTVTSYELDKIEGALRSPKLADAPSLFDGTRFVDGAEIGAANRYMNDFIRANNNVVRTFNGLTGNAQNSPEGKALLDFANANTAKANAMRADWERFEADARAAEELAAQKAAEAAAAEAEALRAEAERRAAEARKQAEEKAMAEVTPAPGIAPDNGPGLTPAPAPTVDEAGLLEGGDDNLAACQAFKRDVMNGNQGRMDTLRAVLAGTSMRIGNADEVKQWRAFASEVKTACEAAGPQVTQRKCKNAYRPEDEPASWCADIERAEEVIRAMVMAEVIGRIETLTRYQVQSVDEFMEQEGWITQTGPQTFDGLFQPAAILNNVAKAEIEAMLAEIDLTLDDVSGELATASEKMNDLKAAVLETARNWELPYRAGENYSTELAGSILSRAYGGEGSISMKDVWLSRSEWKIHKNGLGIPDRRTLPGYALVRVNADPEGLCQLRSFTLTEQFDGTGYQKAQSVKFGYTRFHTCP